jgi:16S rRNA G966 N2-methylase RsmD
MFRIKRLLNGDYDPFVESVQLTLGMSFLDCTLGLASDAIVASFVTGKEGRVVGIEGQKYLAYIVNRGLKEWDSDLQVMNSAMRRIQVRHSNSLDYLKSLPDHSFDCIYFDPMFEESILESDGIKGLSQFALHDDITKETIEEAKRVVKHRIILKDHFKSSRFETYGFEVIRRKTAKFHFGFIQKRNF